MPRGTCGEPSEGHPFRRGCGLGPLDLNEWGICRLCALDNGEGMQAVADAMAEQDRAWLSRKYCDREQYLNAVYEEWGA